MIDSDAADTLRFFRVDPDATSIYDITPPELLALDLAEIRRVRATRWNVMRMREALADGWEIGPELAYEERRLAELEVG